ncbi:Protein REPRESSOR OF SILENCING 3 [Datura stramonium]|nr:Protein REPRESSOR OF SILENCING 3 [Datura stramonium]
MAKGEGSDASTPKTVRIYVGGLGQSVTAEDLNKTFSTPQLGKVESMDIVRTKGRSFAYLDLLPSSDKSLPKLFSTYNGCM